MDELPISQLYQIIGEVFVARLIIDRAYQALLKENEELKKQIPPSK